MESVESRHGHCSKDKAQRLLIADAIDVAIANRMALMRMQRIAIASIIMNVVALALLLWRW